MKVVTYIVLLLLVVALAGGAYFFLFIHQPMADELAVLTAGQPEFEKARKELKRFQDRERQESGWTGPVAESLRKGLAQEISAGKAEVVVAGGRIVVNIAENVLYTPRSVTFAAGSQPAQTNLAGLLKDLKDREIIVGNTAQSVPAQGRGRKRVPARDGRSLAGSRSHELVKALAKNGVPEEVLVAASYAPKLPERGFQVKGDRTVIIISSPAMVSPASAAPPQQAKPASAAAATAPATTAPPETQQPIPISPAPPRSVR